MLNNQQIKYLIYIITVAICLTVLLILINVSNQVDFPHTLFINLDSRTDRVNELTQHFKGWPTPLERVSAVKHSPGWKGCSASHIKCLTLAKQRDYPWVLIVEDDCLLTPNATAAAAQLISLLPYLWASRTEWDIFYGGTTFLTDHKRISHSPPIFQVKGFTTHFCLIHNSSYDKILSSYPKHIDDFTKEIDVFYSENFRIWTTTPFFAKQRPGPSDISGKQADDYTDLFDKAEAELSAY